MGLLETLQVPANELDIFVRSVEIAAYIPGRIRLYSKKLVGDPQLENKVKNTLSAYREIKEVSINTSTGSILIIYEPEVLRRNSELRKAEAYIASHARRK